MKREGKKRQGFWARHPILAGALTGSVIGIGAMRATGAAGMPLIQKSLSRAMRSRASLGWGTRSASKRPALAQRVIRAAEKLDTRLRNSVDIDVNSVGALQRGGGFYQTPGRHAGGMAVSWRTRLAASKAGKRYRDYVGPAPRRTMVGVLAGH